MAMAQVGYLDDRFGKVFRIKSTGFVGICRAVAFYQFTGEALWLVSEGVNHSDGNARTEWIDAHGAELV